MQLTFRHDQNLHLSVNIALSLNALCPTISLVHSSFGFSRIIRGAKGLNLPSILVETRVLDNTWGIFSIARVFMR